MAKSDEFPLAGSTGRNLAGSGKSGRLEQNVQSSEIGARIRIKDVGQPNILESLPSVEPERITSQFNELQMNEIMKMWSSHHTPKNIASSFYIFLWIKVSTHKVFKIEMFGAE